MGREMHEGEMHLAEIFSSAWDDAFEKVIATGFNDLTAQFLEDLYENLNKQCANFENYDIQFDTIDTCLKGPGSEPHLMGLSYCAFITYQIDETIFEFKIYYGEAKDPAFRKQAFVHRSKHIDTVCIMSATDDEKEEHFLSYFSQLRYIA